MMLMPSNNQSGVVHYFAGKYPGKIGLLMSPDGYRKPAYYMPYAFDNGCFTKWESDRFFNMLGMVKLYHKPLWVCVPDAIADAETTFRRWAKYRKKIADMGFRLAFVAQDGMEKTDVPRNAECVFVGGSTEWKLENAHKFKGAAKLLHIGRVNTLSRLRWAEQIGADSVDGTGWFRGPEKKAKFIEWFEGSGQLQFW
jgi:hypothetical protein